MELRKKREFIETGEVVVVGLNLVQTNPESVALGLT
jgi:hypothetical protein